MARIETSYAAGGCQLAAKFIQDMKPHRVRVFIATQTSEIVIRPRVTSAHSDTFVVRGITDIQGVYAWLASVIPSEFLYIVDRIEWAEDSRATVAATMPTS